jgi:hypothetical protein
MTVKRNDSRYIEAAVISFAVYCDDHDLSDEEADVLAERIANDLVNTADDRRSVRLHREK